MKYPLTLITALLLATDISAADIPDLGVVSPKRAVALNADSLRPGLVHFLVEVRSESSPTNIVTITKTNELLTAADMVRVPSGPGILGIRSVYEDGESDVALYRYDLRRGGIPKPSASPIQVLAGPEPEKSLTNEMRRIQDSLKLPTPPSPAVLQSDIQNPRGGTNVSQSDIQVAHSTPRKGFTYTIRDGLLIPIRPLPYGTNKDYSSHLDELSDRARKRRNE